MWGNGTGWTISAIMVILAVAAAIWLADDLALTPPTDLSQNPANMAELTPPPINLVDKTQGSDAGAMYLQAIAAFTADRRPCDQFAANPKGNPPEPLRLLLAAATASRPALFAANPSAIVDYRNVHPELESLHDLGHLGITIGEILEQQKNPRDARTWFRAVGVLGQRMLDERLVWVEYSYGLDLLNTALDGLMEMEPDGSPAWIGLDKSRQALVDFDAQRVRPIYSILSSANPQVIADNAGDVFAFAARAGERMFRVEATLKLGRYRFDAARYGDQTGAARYIRRLQNDADPVVRAAAAAAEDLTIEQYRQIH